MRETHIIPEVRESMESVRVNCLPLNVNAKGNCESGCSGIEKKAEKRSITVNQADRSDGHQGHRLLLSVGFPVRKTTWAHKWNNQFLHLSLTQNQAAKVWKTLRLN